MPFAVLTTDRCLGNLEGFMNRWVLGVSLAIVVAGCGGDDENSSVAGQGGGMNATGGASGAAGASGGSGGMGGSGGAGGSIAEETGGMGGSGGMMEPAGPGACSPPEGPDLDELKSTATLTQLTMTSGIVRSAQATGGFLYVMEDGIGLQRVPEAGGTVEIIVPFEDTAYFMIAEPYIYYGEYSDTTSLPELTARKSLDDLDADPEMPGAPIRGGFRDGHGEHLFGFDRATGELWKQEFSTGTAEVLTMSEDISSMDVADDGFIYYTDQTFGLETLMRISVDGGAPEQLADDDHFNASGVKVIGDSVYWCDGYRMLITPRGPAQMGGTQTLGGFAPAISRFGNGTGYAGGFTEVGDRVYWIDDGSTVGWTSKDRLTCGSIVTDSFEQFFLSDGRLYVETNFEGIWSMAL
jgi:hypothetical protein